MQSTVCDVIPHSCMCCFLWKITVNDAQLALQKGSSFTTFIAKIFRLLLLCGFMLCKTTLLEFCGFLHKWYRSVRFYLHSTNLQHNSQIHIIRYNIIERNPTNPFEKQLARVSEKSLVCIILLCKHVKRTSVKWNPFLIYSHCKTLPSPVASEKWSRNLLCYCESFTNSLTRWNSFW